jgi:hypothetical protein
MENIPFPMGDGCNEVIKPRAWISKFSCFFSLNPEEDYRTIKFATLHLEGPTFLLVAND